MPMPTYQRQPQHVSPAQKHEASAFTLAVVMGGIAAFFIATIASAFIYAKDINPTQTAQAPLPPPAAYDKAEPQTTGSGGGAR